MGMREVGSAARKNVVITLRVMTDAASILSD
jgi:hypothetical protein